MIFSKISIDIIFFARYTNTSIPIDLVRIEMLSKKCEYALRAIFELSTRNAHTPVRTHEIAKSQGISSRFLEVIFNELRHGGFLESKRGNEGGYYLAKPAGEISVGEVISYIQGPISVTRGKSEGEHWGDNAFEKLWKQIDDAITEILATRDFSQLVEYEQTVRDTSTPNYCI